MIVWGESVMGSEREEVMVCIVGNVKMNKMKN